MLSHNDPLRMHVYTDFGRFYRVDDQQYPGVGTVLNTTDSQQQQQFWEKWRSHPENVIYSEAAKNRGKLFHEVVENYFKTPNYRIDSLAVEKDAIAEVRPFWQSIKNVLPRITDIQLIESAVWHEVGHYAGTVDMICSFDGVPVILDWKTASKPKRPEYLDRYPLQLTAYCGCINRMYGTRIKRGVIVVALPESEAQVFQFPLGDHWTSWLKRLVSYWKQQNTPLAEQTLKEIQEHYKT